jgi:hypothetical protein
MAYLALTPANRAPQALGEAVSAMGAGGPAWLSGAGRTMAGLLANHGLPASVVLALAFVVIAVGGCLPRPAAVPALVLAIVVAAAIWVFGEAFGGILAGSGTDPNSGPLLALLAFAFWPLPPV